MNRKCLKCGHERTDSDTSPEYECPRCGAIYAKVEAVSNKGVESDGQLSDEEKIAAIRQRAALNKRYSKKANPPIVQTREYTQKNQMIAIAGSLLLFVGVFSPIVQLPIVGTINIYNQGEGDGIFILIVAALATIFTFTKHFRFHVFAGSVVLVDVAIILYRFTSKLSQAKSQLNIDMADNPFRGFADMAMKSVQLQWGWTVLVIGAVLLISSAFFKDKDC